MIRAIVTDIEGTASSLSFVKDVLFPYARAHMGAFVRRHAGEPAVALHIGQVREAAGDPVLSLGGVIAQLRRWTDEDRKIMPLKALQGMIWEAGYQAGDFRGHVYPDAEQALRAWHARGIALYVYSSGSVQAQQLLFAHTDYGDLTPLFRGYFDTRTGAKTEAQSYRRIAREISLEPPEIAFLSDVQAELDAAAKAGLTSLWLVRGALPDPRAAHPQFSDFGAVSRLIGNPG
jgi:enolase-phosphatase E1